MLRLKFKNIRRLYAYCDYEMDVVVHKYIVFNVRLPSYIRQRAILSGYTNSFKLRCRITNNSKAVRLHWKMNRIALRNSINNNLFNGVKKSAW